MIHNCPHTHTHTIKTRCLKDGLADSLDGCLDVHISLSLSLALALALALSSLSQRTAQAHDHFEALYYAHL